MKTAFPDEGDVSLDRLTFTLFFRFLLTLLAVGLLRGVAALEIMLRNVLGLELLA